MFILKFLFNLAITNSVIFSAVILPPVLAQVYRTCKPKKLFLKLFLRFFNEQKSIINYLFKNQSR